MTVPVIVQPDLEAWVWAQISDLPGVTSFAYAAVQMWPGWVYAHSVQVDARAKRKTAARDTAETARQRIVALPGIDWPEGTVCYVQPVEGPFWQPDPDGLPRYTARYEIRVHPRRDSAAIHPAARRHSRGA
jgi:hypothetical protein